MYFQQKTVAFLLTLLCLVLLSCLVVWYLVNQPSKLSAQGGAYSTTLYTLPLAATSASPTMYGGTGKGGACLGTSGTGANMIKMDFGWAASVLNTKWQSETMYRLCNDRYLWETVTTLPLAAVLQALHWPSDLLTSSYANQAVTLEPLSSFDPVTQQAQQQQQNQQSAETNKACLWTINFLVSTQIDICEPIRLLVGAASAAIRSIYHSAESQISFMWMTPLAPFQNDSSAGLLTVWSTSWAVVLACVTAVIAYAALRYMIGSAVSWLAYANVAELAPRLLFGLLAAYFSKEFFIMLIQGNNALTGIFNQNGLDTVINGKAAGVVNESLQIIYALMGFCLMIEEVARIAILYVLFAFAPILFFFAALRETQRWAKMAATAAVTFTFMQAAQSALLDVGGRVLSTVFKNTGGNLTFLNILISVAILYLTLVLFFSLARLAFGGGIAPYAYGVFAGSLRTLPFAGGAIGRAAQAYRQARNNLFPLPPRSPAGGSGGSTSGGPSTGSAGGSGGNTSGTPGTGGAGGSGRNTSGGPSAGGSGGNISGGPGAGTGSAGGSGGPGAAGARASASSQAGQWRKTPLVATPQQTTAEHTQGPLAQHTKDQNP